MSTVWYWFLHVTGSDNVSGTYYGFWSGFGGDIGLFVALAVFLRHTNCHEPGCLRLGRHPHGPYKYCRRHHPETP